MQKHIQEGLTLYIAGGFDKPITDSCWYITCTMKPQPEPKHTSNAEETDTRLWLHAKQTRCKKILIISPDTDTYHIGLPIHKDEEKKIVVQVSALNS